MKETILGLGVVTVFLLGAGCSTSYNTTNNSQPTSVVPTAAVVSQNQVNINHFVFEPKVLTIKAGQAVTWVHNDNVAHSVISGNLFESPALNRGDKFSFTFNTPGEYEFYCSIHPSMTGKIIVE